METIDNSINLAWKSNVCLQRKNVNVIIYVLSSLSQPSDQALELRSHSFRAWQTKLRPPFCEKTSTYTHADQINRVIGGDLEMGLISRPPPDRKRRDRKDMLGD